MQHGKVMYDEYRDGGVQQQRRRSGEPAQQLHPEALWSRPLPGVTVPALEFAGAGGAESMLYQRRSDRTYLCYLAEHTYP